MRGRADRGNTVNVLIAGGHALTLQLLARVLHNEGYTVVCASDALQALELLNVQTPQRERLLAGRFGVSALLSKPVSINTLLASVESVVGSQRKAGKNG